MALIVQKYGGTSVGSTDRIKPWQGLLQRMSENKL